jgi:hypothetical protein
VSSKALVSTLAIAATVAVPAASAHTLSKATAKREAAKSGAVLARDFGGSPVVDCRRRSDHAFNCRVSVVGVEGDVCVSVIRVAYRGRHDRRVSRSTVSGPVCTPPELLGIL